MELCYLPFSIEDGLRNSLEEPPARCLYCPMGGSRSQPLFPMFVPIYGARRWCKRGTLTASAWRDLEVLAEVRHAIADASLHSRANNWKVLALANA